MFSPFSISQANREYTSRRLKVGQAIRLLDQPITAFQ
jgi:hypothetical protein